MSDKELIKISSQFAKGILGKRNSKAMCFAVSSALQGYLSICGVSTFLIEGEILVKSENGSKNVTWNHFWLQLDDGRILDATSDQFLTPDGKKMPKTFLGAKPEWYTIIK